MDIVRDIEMLTRECFVFIDCIKIQVRCSYHGTKRAGIRKCRPHALLFETVILTRLCLILYRNCKDSFMILKDFIICITRLFGRLRLRR